MSLNTCNKSDGILTGRTPVPTFLNQTFYDNVLFLSILLIVILGSIHTYATYDEISAANGLQEGLTLRHIWKLIPRLIPSVLMLALLFVKKACLPNSLLRKSGIIFCIIANTIMLLSLAPYHLNSLCVSMDYNFRQAGLSFPDMFRNHTGEVTTSLFIYYFTIDMLMYYFSIILASFLFVSRKKMVISLVLSLAYIGFEVYVVVFYLGKMTEWTLQQTALY